jgi:hypothetical protein
MYYERILTTDESLYVSRAQQRIAELSAILSEEINRNDVTFENAELIVELENSIQVLKSTDLTWTSDEIRMMMDYYTIYASLTVFGFRSITFNPVAALNGDVYATVSQLQAVLAASIEGDAELLSLLQSEVIRLEDLIEDITAGSGDAVLLADLTSGITVGGIVSGRTFSLGTPLETIWRALLSAANSISTLTYNAYTAIKEVGAPLVITQFTWTGTSTNLKLSDSEGVLVNQPVTGSSYTPGSALSYPLTTNKTITWTLTGDNVTSLTATMNAYYKSYFGKVVTADDNPITVTEAMILAAGVTSVVNTATSITLPATTSATEQGWIAVPKAQTGALYTKWVVDTMNSATIGVGEFILPPVDVTVNGVVYSVYRWGYRSPLSANITLQR